MKQNFPVSDIQEIEEWGGGDDYEFIERSFSHHSRWSVWYNIIFKYADKYWRVLWPTPATESQESELWSDEIEATEVEPIIIPTTTYVEKA